MFCFKVGVPVALLLMQRNATVTIVHSRTQNIPDIVRQVRELHSLSTRLLPVALPRMASLTPFFSHRVSISPSQADIVVAAVGRAEMVQGEWLKPGAVVVDVGINSVDDASKAKGYRLVGDCAFESCKEAASYITPVPGSVQ